MPDTVVAPHTGSTAARVWGAGNLDTSTGPLYPPPDPPPGATADDAAAFSTSFAGLFADKLDVPASSAQPSPLIVGTARWVCLGAFYNRLADSEWSGPDLPVFTPTSACLSTCFLEVSVAAPTNSFEVSTARPIFLPSGSNRCHRTHIMPIVFAPARAGLEAL